MKVQVLFKNGMGLETEVSSEEYNELVASEISERAFIPLGHYETLIRVSEILAIVPVSELTLVK